MPSRGLLALCLCLGCSKPAAPDAAPGAPDSVPAHALSDNWKGSPCTARGQRLTLRGHIRVEPFGKGTDGAVLQAEDGTRWIVTYRAEGIVLQLRDKQVEVQGRACDKQFESLGGPHFDVEWIRPL